MLKVLITGSREASDYLLWQVLDYMFTCKEIGHSIVVGDAPGVDATVIRWCDKLGIPITVYGAYSKVRNKTTTGKNVALPCGYLERNLHMIEKANLCCAFWNGISRGTKHTMDNAKKFMPVRVVKG